MPMIYDCKQCSSTIKHPWPIPKQTAAMPLSEPMKAAIVLAIVMAIVMAVVAAVLAMVAAVLGEAIANAAQVLASALGAKPVATYAGVGGFAGGFFDKETACEASNLRTWCVSSWPRRTC